MDVERSNSWEDSLARTQYSERIEPGLSRYEPVPFPTEVAAPMEQRRLLRQVLLCPHPLGGGSLHYPAVSADDAIEALSGAASGLKHPDDVYQALLRIR